MADPSKGGLGHPRSDFFHFRVVVGKKSCQIIGFCPKLRGWRPCGKSWIRHCIEFYLTTNNDPKTEIGYKSDISLQNLHNPVQVLDFGRSGSRISRETPTPSGATTYYLLPTAREGNVFKRVCDSVHNWPDGYLVTAHPCWLLGHSSLRRGRYASYWNAFLFNFFSTKLHENEKKLHRGNGARPISALDINQWNIQKIQRCYVFSQGVITYMFAFKFEATLICLIWS